MEKRTFRVYIADLAEYNAGNLRGEWYDLDDFDDEDELRHDVMEFLKEKGHEEYAIHDYEGFPEGMNLSEYEDFKTLFDIKELYRDACYDAEVTDAAMVVADYDVEQAEKYLKEYHGHYNSVEDLAREFCEDIGYIPKDFPWWIVIDWEKTGQYLSTDYVEHNGHYFQNV